MKKKFTKLSIIIPAYNEAKTIHFILDKVKAVVLPNDIQKELIIVNDFSSDGTDKAIEKYMNENPELKIQLFNQDKNYGKGAIIKSGGIDVLDLMKEGLIAPDRIINIRNIIQISKIK